MHDWSRDPFSRGAYSYLAVGGGAARAVLSAPIDDAVFFAGEATAAGGQAGTVNGALESGERAAAKRRRCSGTNERDLERSVVARAVVELLRHGRLVGRGVDGADVRRHHPSAQLGAR